MKKTKRTLIFVLAIVCLVSALSISAYAIIRRSDGHTIDGDHIAAVLTCDGSLTYNCVARTSSATAGRPYEEIGDYEEFCKCHCDHVYVELEFEEYNSNYDQTYELLLYPPEQQALIEEAGWNPDRIISCHSIHRKNEFWHTQLVITDTEIID